jgi:hypothetical protein
MEDLRIEINPLSGTLEAAVADCGSAACDAGITPGIIYRPPLGSVGIRAIVVPCRILEVRRAPVRVFIQKLNKSVEEHKELFSRKGKFFPSDLFGF